MVREGVGPVVWMSPTRWWSTISTDPATGPFVAECSTAQDAFLRMLAGK